jgi:hypothetical protein
MRFHINTNAQMYLNVLYTTKDTKAALGYIFNVIENAFHDQNLTLINTILAKFNPKQANTVIATGLIRATCKAKKQLSSWTPCLQAIKKELINRNENVNYLLRGLI